jgi:hypothetical protein
MSVFPLILFCFVLFFCPLCCESKKTPTNSVNSLITRDGLKNMSIALELYKREFGEYPETLEELFKKKNIQDSDILEDAWGRPYYYEKLSAHYVLFSTGKDGKPFTEDDVLPPEEE